MEWKKIILVGVDLYDSRYFFKNNETLKTDFLTGEQNLRDILIKGSNLICSTPPLNEFNRPNKSMVKKFKENNVKLYVYNPESLLAKILPIYRIKL